MNEWFTYAFIAFMWIVPLIIVVINRKRHNIK